MSLCYAAAVGVWAFMSTAVTRFEGIRMSFYGSAGIAVASVVSTWCYYKSLAKIKKERLVTKLINDED